MRSGRSFSPDPTETGDLVSRSPSDVLPVRQVGSGDASKEDRATDVPLVFIFSIALVDARFRSDI